MDTLWSGPVHLYRCPARDAVTNMAIDEAMLLTAGETGTTFFRLYQWSAPSVSFGRNQRCTGLYASERCRSVGVPAVRRLTGGRALLHGREVTYSVAAPVSAAPTLRGGYDAINTLLLDALHRLGVKAERAAPSGRTVSPGLSPCFEMPSAGELVVGDRKLVGSAQHRDAAAFLQHGSILLDDDQGMLASLALVPLPPVPPPATLRACAGVTDADVVMDSIVGTLRDVAGGGIVVTDEAHLPEAYVRSALSRYRDPDWTWRR
ncbi:MAG TPA: hypothetical protein VE861_04955 [Gemmatimonadaceae bacterium]|nr:hypothetical protein [Gemmatimonadaceae bacterium]